MVALARVAMRDPVFRRTVSQPPGQHPRPGRRRRAPYESENELLDIDPEADGVKTGMTDGAGYALVAHARRAARSASSSTSRSIGAPSSDGARPRRSACSTGASPSTRGPAARPGAVARRASRCRRRPGRDGALPRPAPRSRAPLRLGAPARASARRAGRGGAARSRRASRSAASPPPGRAVVGRPRPGRRRGGRRPGIWDRVRAGVEALIP